MHRHDDGTFEERRIATTRDRLAAVLATYRPARILLEASPESEWVARHIEQLGHEVIVADPNVRSHVRQSHAPHEDRPA